MTELSVAVVGATGLVGETVLTCMASSQLPIKQIYAVASERSKEKTVSFGKEFLPIEVLDEFDFSKVNLAFFCAGKSVSENFAKKAVASGAIVIDNSSAFRCHSEVPLIVPEVNAHALDGFVKGIVANPNCSTIQMCVALKPIYDLFGLARVHVATYQSVSGTGRRAIQEIIHQTGQLLNGHSAESSVYPMAIAFNCLPHIDEFEDNGYTREEMKMYWETQKIFQNTHIHVNATAVRVPTVFGHGLAIHAETDKLIDLKALIKRYKASKGVELITQSKKPYPTTMSHAVGKDEVFVGRLRQDLTNKLGVNLWVVADNVRKGAASNAVQIAELLHQAGKLVVTS